MLNDGQGRGSELMKQGAQLSSFFKSLIASEENGTKELGVYGGVGQL